MGATDEVFGALQGSSEPSCPMLGHTLDKFCYFSNNVGMNTTSPKLPRPVAGDSRLSQELSRQLARALAAPLGLAKRPLHRVAAGTSMLKAGDRPPNLPYVVSGRLDAIVHLPGKTGGQIVPVCFRAGEVGLLSYLFNQQPNGADVVSGEASVIKWVPVRQIESTLLDDPAMMILLVRFLGQRLREAQARERGWAARGVLPRLGAGLMRLLSDLPKRDDGRVVIEATHEEIADRCGISRPRASTALKQMEREGLVVLGRKSVEVLDLGALVSKAV